MFEELKSCCRGDNLNKENYLNSAEFEYDKLYWKNQLDNCEGYIKNYNVVSHDFNSKKVVLSDELVSKIEKFTETKNISYFNFFISIFSLYLSRIDMTKGCILKTGISTDNYEFKLNTLFKLDYIKEDSFIDYLNNVSDSYNDAINHTKTEIEDYVGDIVNLVHYSINDLTNDEINIEDKNSVLILNIYLNDLQIIYNSSFFKEDYIEHMLENLLSMTDNVLNSPETCCKDINILSDTEKKLLNMFCKGDTVDIDDDYTLAKAFRYNALKNPDKIAVNDGITQITYGDLEKSSNSIAYELQNKYDIKKGTPVCLMLPRNYHFPEFVLALNKIGAYYIPIDSKYPTKRIEYVINSCQSKHIVTTNAFRNLHNFNITVIYQEDLNPNLDVDVEIQSTGDDLFSILFTSGTAGMPREYCI